MANVTVILSERTWEINCKKMYLLHPMGASLMAQMVKNLPAMQETRVRSLGQEDPLEKKMATHSGILAWRITVHGVTKSRTSLSD